MHGSDRRRRSSLVAITVTPVKKAAVVSTLHFTLAQTAASAARARRQVGAFIQTHELCDEPQTAVLIVSELVANAILHGAEPIEVAVTGETGKLRIEVSDGDTRPPRPDLDVDRVDRPSGRGLLIVNALAQRWGTTLHDFGKTVWAEVDIPNRSRLTPGA